MKKNKFEVENKVWFLTGDAHIKQTYVLQVLVSSGGIEYKLNGEDHPIEEGRIHDSLSGAAQEVLDISDNQNKSVIAKFEQFIK